MKLIPLLFLLFILFSACTSSINTDSAYLLIQGGTLINPTDKTRDIEKAYILIKNNTIESIGALSEKPEIPQGTKIINAEGKYIIPGLIDGFAVMNNQFYANAFLHSGVTTILGVDGGRRGWFYPTPNPGPDFYMLESVGDEILPDSVHLNHLYALHEKNYKIALLKYKLSPRQVKLIHEEAKKLGMGTIGELGYTTYEEAGEIGVDAFVHTTRYSLDVAPEKMRRAVADHPFSNDLSSPKWKYYQYLYGLDTAFSGLRTHAECLASTGAFLMPTLSLLYGDLPGMKNPWDEKIASILNPSDINNPLDKTTGKHNYSKEVQSNYTAMGLQELKIETLYKNAGAKYLAGSGTDVWGTMPGISLHTELLLLEEIGLDPRQVLAAATHNFSEAFGWNTGKLEVGYEADVLILDKNPLENIQNLKQISLLVNNGKTIDLEPLTAIPYEYGLEDGSIIYRKAFNPFSDSLVKKLIFNLDKSAADKTIKPEYNFLEDVKTDELLYASDGFRVKAYMAYPKAAGTYPVIIYNRGGNREFSKISPKRVVDVLARMASWGYVVIGSQYRGVDGGDGQEEFGGADLQDVLNLIALVKSIPEADPDKIGMYGRSRGGMMTYLSLTQTDRIKAAVIVGGVTNLQQMNDARNGIMEEYVYSQLIPAYWQNKDSLLKARSAIYRIDEMNKKTAVLVMHGTADWRVIPEESYAIAREFQKKKMPYRLVMFEGGDHGLTEFKEESNELIRSWFDKYLTRESALPNLEPHGK